MVVDPHRYPGLDGEPMWPIKRPDPAREPLEWEEYLARQWAASTVVVWDFTIPPTRMERIKASFIALVRPITRKWRP